VADRFFATGPSARHCRLAIHAGPVGFQKRKVVAEHRHVLERGVESRGLLPCALGVIDPLQVQVTRDHVEVGKDDFRIERARFRRFLA
jgi:hypothetical protein